VGCRRHRSHESIDFQELEEPPDARLSVPDVGPAPMSAYPPHRSDQGTDADSVDRVDVPQIDDEP
jgi:hypothetical protein